MKKILFITFQFKTGGVERIFNSIANNLNCEIALMTITNRYDSMVNNIPSSVEIVPIHKSRWFQFLWFLNNYIPFVPFVIILLSEIIYLRFNKKWKKYTIINFSDTISSLFVSYYSSTFKECYSWLHYNPRSINLSKFSFLYKFVYRKMHKIICICNEQKEILLEVIPKLNRNKLVVIYNIMDFNYIHKLKNERIEYKEKFILMIARFDFRSKDFFTLIDAYHNLCDKIKQTYNLLLMGDGPDLQSVQQYVIKKNEENNIIFIGKEDNPYKWIAKSEALILSSKSEGLPTVLIEGLICGIPVISTNCETGPKEILDNGKCGLLTPVGNVNMLTKAIETIITDVELRDKYISEGLKKINQFHPNQIIPQIHKLWTN